MNDTFLVGDKSQMAGKNQQRGFNTKLISRQRKLFLYLPQMFVDDHSVTGLNNNSLPMGPLLIGISLNTDMF